MKKMLAVLLTLALMIGLMPAAFAAGEPAVSLEADKTSVQAGETVTVTLSLDQDIDLTGFEFYVCYNTALFTHDTTANTVTDAYSSTTMVSIRTNDEGNGIGSVSVNAVAPGNGDVYTFPAGDIATLSFVAKEDITAETPASFYVINMGVFGEGFGILPSDTVTVATDAANPVPVTVTPAAPASDADYTVTISDNVDGTAEVEIGNTVTMNVTVTGGAVNGVLAEIEYDSTLFTYQSGTIAGATSNVDTNGQAELTPSAGSIGIYWMSAAALNGDTLATLVFTANTVDVDTTGDFTVTTAKAADYAGALADAEEATKEGDSVLVKAAVEETYSVTVDSAIANGTVAADKTEAAEGEIVTLTVNPATGYELSTLTVTAASGAPIAVTNNAFTMPASNVTVSATFVKTVYSLSANATNATVTFDPETATYGETVTITVAPTLDENEEVESVTVTVNGETVTVTEQDDGTYTGTFTMPAANVTADVVVTVKTVTPEFTVTTYADYVTGYTLVVVTGDAENGYTYDGNAMYETGDGTYAWLVSGAADTSLVAVNDTAKACPAVSVNNVAKDVNDTGIVDFNDALAAFGCYNVVTEYPVDTYMAMYLRADVNGDRVVDIADVNAILTAIAG